MVDALPDAPIVHIVRDGRDCANSLVESYDVLSDEKLTHLKGSEMRLGRSYDERYVPSWVEEGRDEEFISSSPYVRAIWMWKAMVGRCRAVYGTEGEKTNGQVMVLRYEDFMKDPLAHGRAVLRHFGVAPTPAFEKRIAQARTSSIGKHKKRDTEEGQAAESVGRSELEAYGYLTSEPLL